MRPTLRQISSSMFTGLVETTGTVLALERGADCGALSVRCGAMAGEMREGDSLAINGCCLTVTTIDAADQALRFDLLAETLRVTNLGDLAAGSLVNLERAMAIGARFGGHFVQGHVDTTARLLDWSPQGGDYRLEVALPAEFRGLVIPKGSICLDGISLTAAEVKDTSLVCWIIPHTRQVTNLQTRKTGERLNVEFDMLGKYVQNLLARPRKD